MSQAWYLVPEWAETGIDMDMGGKITQVHPVYLLFIFIVASLVMTMLPFTIFMRFRGWVSLSGVLICVVDSSLNLSYLALFRALLSIT